MPSETRASTGNRRVDSRWLCVMLAAAAPTVAAMIAGGAWLRPGQVTWAAVAFAVAAVTVAVLANVDHVLGRARCDTAAAGQLGQSACDVVRGNAHLAALAYGWGAVAMQGLYLTPLTGLRWQHGWQYALAMALLCAVSLAYARTSRPRRSAALLAWAQGLIAAGGLGALIATGKLWSVRNDWAANRVFAALAVAILAISAATLVSLACANARSARLPGTPQS